MPTSLGYVDDVSSWSQNSCFSAGGHFVQLTTNVGGDIGNLIYLGTPLGREGIIKFTYISNGSTSGTLYFGFVDAASSTSLATALGTAATFYGFGTNQNSANSNSRFAGATSDTFTNWFIGNDGLPHDVYVAYAITGTTMVMKLYVDGIAWANGKHTFIGTAPAFTTMRPAIGGASGGSFFTAFATQGAPTFDTSFSANPISGITQYGYSTAADVQWDTNPLAASYDWRVNGGSITNVADTGSQGTARITGLTNGTTYLFEIRAVNSTGSGPWQSVTLTPQVSYLWDDFNRTASTTVIGSPVSGGPYTVVTGTWGVIGGVLAGQVYTSVSTASSYVTFPAAADVDITFQIPATGATTTGVLLRYVDASNRWFFGYTQGTGLTLSRTVTGTGVILFGLNRTALATDVYRVIAKGPMFYIFLNGLLRATVYDTALQTATVCAIWMNSTAAARMDDLLVVAAPADPLAGFGSGTTDTALGTSDVTGAAIPSSTGWEYRGRDTKALDLAGVS